MSKSYSYVARNIFKIFNVGRYGTIEIEINTNNL